MTSFPSPRADGDPDLAVARDARAHPAVISGARRPRHGQPGQRPPKEVDDRIRGRRPGKVIWPSRCHPACARPTVPGRRVALPTRLLVILGVVATGCGGPTDNIPRATNQAGSPSPAPRWSVGAKVNLEPCPAGTSEARTRLPRVTLRCLGPGPAVTIDRLPPRPYLINLWASWCAPCQREAPRLASAAASARGRVNFLGIDTADQAAAALSFLDKFRLRYPQLADPNSDTLHRLAAPGIPVTVALDATGRIVYRRIGEISNVQLAAALRAASPDPPAGAGGNE